MQQALYFFVKAMKELDFKRLIDVSESLLVCYFVNISGANSLPSMDILPEIYILCSSKKYFIQVFFNSLVLETGYA